MKKYILNQRFILVFPLAAVLLLALISNSSAQDVTAGSCSYGDVQSAVDQIENAGGGTVQIPAGSCTWNDTMNVSGPVSFVGAGVGKTIITLGTDDVFFSHTSAGGTDDDPIIYTGFSFYAPDGRASGDATGIYFRDADNYRVHNNYFEGCWHVVIGGKRNVKGLIDNNTFVRTDDYSSDYGIELGQRTLNKPICTDIQNDQGCIDEWDAWWDDSSANNGMIFEENYNPSSGEAIYVEDNTFYWRGSAIQANWGNGQKIVFRYNTYEIRDGNLGGVKPGTQYALIYNNTFKNVAPGAESNPSATALYFRATGMVFDNTFINYSKAVQFYTYYCGYGYCFTDQARMHETYVWNNNYINAECTGDSDCAYIGNQGNYPLKEGVDFFLRAPEAGERLFGFSLYQYPHPLRGGGLPSVNHAPSLDAGSNQTITLPDNSAILSGTVTDDELPDPPGEVSTTWSRVSGPGIVTFDDDTAVDATATFSEAGTYVLELMADDGELNASDVVTVEVSDNPPPPPTDTGNDDAAGNAALNISNLSNASAAEYQIVEGLTDGNACYIDRSYTYSNVPDFLQGAVYIKTAMNDKNNMADPLLSFDVNTDVTVYVAFDNRAAIPFWLSDFTDTGYDLSAYVSHSIYAKDFPAGKITLGPYGQGGSMYTVIIVLGKPAVPKGLRVLPQ